MRVFLRPLGAFSALRGKNKRKNAAYLQLSKTRLEPLQQKHCPPNTGRCLHLLNDLASDVITTITFIDCLETWSINRPVITPFFPVSRAVHHVQDMLVSKRGH